jgi:hypothetical protein
MSTILKSLLNHLKAKFAFRQAFVVIALLVRPVMVTCIERYALDV